MCMHRLEGGHGFIKILKTSGSKKKYFLEHADGSNNNQTHSSWCLARGLAVPEMNNALFGMSSRNVDSILNTAPSIFHIHLTGVLRWESLVCNSGPYQITGCIVLSSWEPAEISRGDVMTFPARLKRAIKVINVRHNWRHPTFSRTIQWQEYHGIQMRKLLSGMDRGLTFHWTLYENLFCCKSSTDEDGRSDFCITFFMRVAT